MVRGSKVQGRFRCTFLYLVDGCVRGKRMVEFQINGVSGNALRNSCDCITRPLLSRV